MVGVKMVDFETMIKGAKIKWIKQYLDFGDGDWKKFLENFCEKENLNVFLEVIMSIKKFLL